MTPHRALTAAVLAIGVLACSRDRGVDSNAAAQSSNQTSQPPASAAVAAPAAPADSSGLLNAPLRPKTIVSQSIPAAGARVVMCIQQTASSGERAPSDCRAYVVATGGKAGVSGASLHAIVKTYIGGEPYGTLYARAVSTGSDLNELERGPRVANDDTGYGQLVVKDDKGNYLLFFELERH